MQLMMKSLGSMVLVDVMFGICWVRPSCASELRAWDGVPPVLVAPSCVVLSWYLYFFFQAEDGIRDLTVTGVQTCALPICRRHVAGEEEPLGVVVQQGHRGLQQRAVDALAEAGLCPVEQRVADAERGEDPGREVEERDAGSDRRTAGLSGDRHDAAERLHEGFVSGAVLPRPGPSERRDRAVDQPRVERGQGLVAETEALHRARPEILDEHVGALDQIPKDVSAFRSL